MITKFEPLLCCLCLPIGNKKLRLFRHQRLFLQDPFELNLCVTKGYCEDAKKIWILHCQAAADCLKTSRNFLSILEQSVQVDNIPKNPGERKKFKKMAKLTKIYSLGSIQDNDGLHYAFQTISSSFEDLHKVKLILRSILKVKLW